MNQIMFRNGDFVGHSGQPLAWKIDCDALTPDDWAWAAARVAERVSFYAVHGIPTGGKAFEIALSPYCQQDGEYFLLVDDVLTTGKSFLANSFREAHMTRSDRGILGVVLFARIPPPEPWIKALFIMPEWS